MVLIAAAAIGVSFYQQMRAELEAARAEHARIETTAVDIQIANERLAAEISDLRNNPEVIEQAARQLLGMVRPGEIVLSVKPPNPSEGSSNR